MNFKEEFKKEKFLIGGILVCVFITGWIAGNVLWDLHVSSIQNQEQSE